MVVVGGGAGRVAGAVTGVAVAGHLVASGIARASRHLGATDDEVGRSLPGDEVDAGRTRDSTRAVTLPAPPAQVWPWLVQMGYGRGGWYAVDRLERAIGAGDFLTGGSATEVVPELQDLAVGDRVPLSEDHALIVARLDPPPADPAALVLVLPSGPITWVSTYALFTTDGGTRLVVRTRMGARAAWARPALLSLELGHAVMEVVQLRNLRARVSAAARPVSASPTELR
jgi:hypothetical protein